MGCRLASQSASILYGLGKPALVMGCGSMPNCLEAYDCVWKQQAENKGDEISLPALGLNSATICASNNWVFPVLGRGQE